VKKSACEKTRLWKQARENPVSETPAFRELAAMAQKRALLMRVISHQ
jgi:hypothetical protein